MPLARLCPELQREGHQLQPSALVSPGRARLSQASPTIKAQRNTYTSGLGAFSVHSSTYLQEHVRTETSI